MVKKERRRYVLFKIISDFNLNLNNRDLLNAIWQSIWRYFGMREAMKIGLWLQELDTTEGYGILKCSQDTKELIIAALTLVRELNGKTIIISPLKTSGTIKTLKKVQNAFLSVQHKSLSR